MFAERLKMLRKKKNLTQKELGVILNISDRVLSYYEAGNRFPSDENTLNAIADYFDVTTDYLLGRTDEKDVYVLTGEDVPKELREIGVDEIGILKQFKDSGFTKEEIQEILEFAKKMKKQS